MANGTQDWRESAWQRERQADPQNLIGGANAPAGIGPQPKPKGPQLSAAQQTQQANDAITAALNMYTGPGGQAINTQEALTYLRARDPNLFRPGEDPQKISDAIAKIATGAQWQPNIYGTGGAGGSADNVLDPIGVQQFYASTIAPFMGQLGQNEQWVTQQYQNMANQSIPGLPASYNAALQNNARSMAAAGQHAYDTSTQAAAQQPLVNNISNQLANLIKLKTTDITQQAKLAGTQGAQVTGANIPSGLG